MVWSTSLMHMINSEPLVSGASGCLGEHLAIHDQRRLLPVGEAEERAPRSASVQTSREETASSAQGSSAFR